MPSPRPILLATSLATLLALPACGSSTGKVLATPLTVVRDVVDAPLVTLTNVFEYWADRSNPIPTASAGVGISTGGIFPAIGLNLSYWIFKPLSWIVGGVDYVVGRSLWPDWPSGLTPWLPDGASWGRLYFPSTRAVWGDEAEVVREMEGDDADAEPTPSP